MLTPTSKSPLLGSILQKSGAIGLNATRSGMTDVVVVDEDVVVVVVSGADCTTGN